MQVDGLSMTVKPGVAATPGADVVVVRDVSKSFGETHALRACSFSARAGEVHAIVGENGSGKSTLAKLLAGVLHPDSGSVEVNGKRPANPQVARQMGVAVVFQDILVAEGGTVLDNLFLGDDGLFRAKTSPRDKRARAQKLLSGLLPSPIDVDTLVDELPLNTRQWIVIARALLADPRIVVFDESTAALDHPSVERFFEVVRKLRDSGVCVLIVTHRIHELTTICDRATVLSDGAQVSTLTGPEITEARLLELVRGETTRTETPHALVFERPPRAPAAQRQEALVASRLKLRPHSTPIDLTVHTGEIVGLAGLEGHGQVEFIQTVTGFRQALAGDVYIRRDGRTHSVDSPKSADRAGIAYIPGDRKLEGLFPNLSVFENFGISCYRATSKAGLINRRAIKKMFSEQVEALSIRLGRASSPINSLSGGNQQKVIIGRAIAASPMVIALNDPTRGVDIGAKRDLYALLHRLAERGKAILFLSNEVEEFAGLCDRVAIFRFQSVFAMLGAQQTTSDAVLAAMFGYNDSEGFDRVRR
jgi:ribose transport system ATP-binding protein